MPLRSFLFLILQKINLSNSRAEKNIEHMYNDTDANANTAIIELYKNKILVKLKVNTFAV